MMDEKKQDDRRAVVDRENNDDITEELWKIDITALIRINF
jgi:hypothetical protein